MFQDHHFEVPVRTPKDVLCLGCKVKFTLSADEFDNQTRSGAVEEHKFQGMHFTAELAKYTVHDCPHCRKVPEARLTSQSTVGRQMAAIRIRRMELESQGQGRVEATTTAVAEQMAADE